MPAGDFEQTKGLVPEDPTSGGRGKQGPAIPVEGADLPLSPVQSQTNFIGGAELGTIRVEILRRTPYYMSDLI